MEQTLFSLPATRVAQSAMIDHLLDVARSNFAIPDSSGRSTDWRNWRKGVVSELAHRTLR